MPLLVLDTLQAILNMAMKLRMNLLRDWINCQRASDRRKSNKVSRYGNTSLANFFQNRPMDTSRWGVVGGFIG
jgi:hypothetical protein